jgi:predicted MFS family arabinose efflux permease
VPAQLGDMYGVFNIMIVHTLISGIFNLAIWLPAKSNAPIIVFAALYGYSSGCTLSIIPAMVAKLSDPRELGARTGSLYCISAIGVLIGSPIAGAISNSENGGFSGLIIFSGMTLLVGTVFSILARQSLVGRFTIWAKV